MDKSKFDPPFGKLQEEKPLTYEELVKEPKLQEDGKRKQSGRKFGKLARVKVTEYRFGPD